MDRRFVPLFLAIFLMLAPLALAQDEPPADAEGDNATADDGTATNETGSANETGAEGENATGEEAAPAAQGATEFTLEAVAEGSSFFFRDAETGARNPTLYVQPGAEITITLVGVSGMHNIHVEGFDGSDYVNVGETTTYTFTAPAEGESLPYWCDPHKSSGMVGTVVAGAPPAGGGGGGSDAESPEINGPSVDLGTLGYPQCAGFMIPRSTAEGEVGGPTVADYVERCESGGETAGTFVAAAHPADYVIPVTWALIGLGIVGVVWVHRHYKP